MGNISLEDKLQLVRQVKSRYQSNRYDMNRREQILFGHTSEREYDMNSEMPEGYDDRNKSDAEEANPFFSRIRLGLAILMTAALFVCDRHGISLFGMDTDAVFAAISYDASGAIGAAVETWAVSHTESSENPVAGTQATGSQAR